VTGLVGAAGGLGGFFPPLLLGVIKQHTGAFTGGFVLLSIFGLACLAVLLLTNHRRAAVVAPEVKAC
jgi:NNP family nitrate/nitrite transporter-like MFS transporter